MDGYNRTKRGLLASRGSCPQAQGSQTLSGAQLGLGKNRSGFKGCEAEDTQMEGGGQDGANKEGLVQLGPASLSCNQHFQGSQPGRHVRAGAQSWPSPAAARLRGEGGGAQSWAPRDEDKGQKQSLPRPLQSSAAVWSRLQDNAPPEPPSPQPPAADPLIPSLQWVQGMGQGGRGRPLGR